MRMGSSRGWYFAYTSIHARPSTVGGFVRSPQGVFTLFSPPGRL
jgi:hypothetical protein